jgi:hypothetical protein
MADQTNPFTMAGMMGMMMPNPYTQYKGALPFQGFRGPATDAQGNTIQSFADAQAAHDAWRPPATPTPAQGTTLNSAPQQRGGLSFAALAPTSPGGPSTQAQYAYNLGLGGVGPSSSYNPSSPQGQAAMQQPAAAAAPAPSNPIDMRQAYLDALANPGPVATPGATVPQAAPLGQPSVLNSFLATHAPGPAAPAGGGYSNAGFFNTLNKLRTA